MPAISKSTSPKSTKHTVSNLKKEPDLIWGDKVKVEHIDWLWPNRIPFGMLSLFAGIGGSGKSTLSLYMAAQITTGRPWIDDPATTRKPGDVILLSAEDSPGNVIVPRLIAMQANISRICILKGTKITLPDGTTGLVGIEDLSKSGDLDMLIETLDKAPNPQLVVIDPYTAYMGNSDSNSNTEVRSFLRPLAEIAADYKIAVLGITHLNKNQDLAADFRILGSVGQQNAARMVWLVAADQEDFDRRFFVWLKGNLAPRHHGLAFRLVGVPVSTPDGRSSSQPTCNFEREPILLTATELLAPYKGPVGRPAKQNDAVQWLDSFLSDGPVDSKLVLEEGKSQGYSERTLRRVKKAMGIMAIPIRNVGSDKVLRWEWRLKSTS